MCVSVCECGCCVCRAFIVFLRFSLCQECEESTEIAYVAICYEGATVSAVPVCVCVCCRRVNVHQSIQPCLQSLILVIYSEAEQGHAFETAPGEQIKGKGSSPSS